jgi:sulfonate transport system substrate-binding protein
MDFKKRREEKMKRLLSSLIVISLLIGITGIDSLFADEKKPKVIRIGSAYGGGFGKPFSSGTIGIVHVKGLLEEEFKKDGIKFEWYFFKGAGPALNEAVANDSIDFGYVGDLPSIIGKAGGLKTKLVAAGSIKGNMYIAVPYDSEITKISDLKGKKVGVSRGTYSHLVFSKILDHYGLTEKDFKLYYLSIADNQTALASKDLDAGVIPSSVLALRTLGTVKIIYSTKKESVELRGAAGFVVTEKFANKYPDITKRVLKAYLKAAKWISDEKNREEVFQIWSKQGTPFAVYKEEYEGDLLKDRENPRFTDFYVEHYKDTVHFAKKRGWIKNEFDVDKWLDKELLEAALKEIGWEE